MVKQFWKGKRCWKTYDVGLRTARIYLLGEKQDRYVRESSRARPKPSNVWYMLVWSLCGSCIEWNCSFESPHVIMPIWLASMKIAQSFCPFEAPQLLFASRDYGQMLESGKNLKSFYQESIEIVGRFLCLSLSFFSQLHSLTFSHVHE